MGEDGEDEAAPPDDERWVPYRCGAGGRARSFWVFGAKVCACGSDAPWQSRMYVQHAPGAHSGDACACTRRQTNGVAIYYHPSSDKEVGAGWGVGAHARA